MGAITELSLHALIGIFGAFLYLASYAALQFGFIRGRGYIYAAFNLAAALCVLISLFKSFNISSFLIQLSWIVISIIGLTRFYHVHRRLTFTTAESSFLRSALPNLAKEDARTLLDHGYWVSGKAGDALTKDGQPVSHLIYLARGSATVISAGRAVAHIDAGSFIGEITFKTQTRQMEVWCLIKIPNILPWRRKALRSFLKRNAVAADMLELAISRQLRSKLVSLHKAVADDNDFEAKRPEDP